MFKITSTQSSNSKRPIMLGMILLILFAVFCKILPSDPVIASKLEAMIRRSQQSNFDEFDPKKKEKKDPKLGSILPIHDIGQKIRLAAGKPISGTLLVNLGDCTGCINVDFERWVKESKKRGISIVAVSYATPENIALMEKTFSTKETPIPIVHDPDGRIMQDLNGYWSGRAYLYDCDWHLRWLKHGLSANKNIYEEPDLASVTKNGEKR